MTVALVIEPNGVNIHLASAFISQYEALRDAAFDLGEPVGRQNFPHPELMGVPHDEVQVFVFACLLANKGVDTPAAVQPHVGARRVEPPQNLDDIGGCHRHARTVQAHVGAMHVRSRRVTGVTRPYAISPVYAQGALRADREGLGSAGTKNAAGTQGCWIAA